MASHPVDLNAKSKSLIWQFGFRCIGWFSTCCDLFLLGIWLQISSAPTVFGNYRHQLIGDSACATFGPYMIERHWRIAHQTSRAATIYRCLWWRSIRPVNLESNGLGCMVDYWFHPRFIAGLRTECK